MEEGRMAPIMVYFSVIEDPREEVNKIYPLHEVIAITLLAVMCFARGWEDIQRYGEAKKEWLSKFLKLEHGIPKHDVYRRVFCALKPEAVKECFMNWVRAIKKDIKREVIAIDGKTLRGSFNARTGAKAIHLVSAWATANKLVFGQVKTEEKSNEITAIPTLLEMIGLEGCIVTIDAMGCQYEIANKIVKRKADYLFSLKGNQESLHEDVKEYFQGVDFSSPASKIDKHIAYKTVSSHDEGHGRIEERDYAVSDDVAWLIERHPNWGTIKSIGMVESTRTVKDKSSGEEKTTTERRYFISTLGADPQVFSDTVRAHWGIENCLHYVLDVTLGEDSSRIRSDNGPENMAYLRKIVLSVARSDKETKSSVAGRIKQMAWSDEYLEKLLFNSEFASQAS
jgi:predicted transposase YbfD/YdcC